MKIIPVRVAPTPNIAASTPTNTPSMVAGAPPLVIMPNRFAVLLTTKVKASVVPRPAPIARCPASRPNKLLLDAVATTRPSTFDDQRRLRPCGSLSPATPDFVYGTRVQCAPPLPACG